MYLKSHATNFFRNKTVKVYQCNVSTERVDNSLPKIIALKKDIIRLEGLKPQNKIFEKIANRILIRVLIALTRFPNIYFRRNEKNWIVLRKL